MSYCVHCGVELAASEKECPLCQTEVVNPRSPWEKPVRTPYPQRFEAMTAQIDRSFFATIVGVLLLIPLLITVFCDLATGGGLSWSLYVAGGLALCFVWFLLPLFFKKYRPTAFSLVNCTAAILYLALINHLMGGSWFLPYGLPISLTASVLIVVQIVLIPRKKQTGLLPVLAWSLLCIGLFVVAVNLIVEGAAGRPTVPGWSVYAFVPCVLLSIVVSVLERRKDLKERIRRRLFF
ncbi:MAG: hypothetical protein IKD06_01810 [Clostridia bacterium]|nr:hypothetical protein [Clostridia bacterium]